MSLVLEALKKLDREKGREERGFVVMAAAPWPTPAARRWPLWAALAVVGVGAGLAVVGLRAVRVLQAPAPPVTQGRVSVPAVVPAGAPLPAPPSSLRRGSSRAAFAPDTPIAVPPTTIPAGARPSPTVPALVLQAISERDGHPIAIVNDHLVRVGDEVEGIRVLAIRVDEVDVEFHGRRTTLRF